MNFWILFKSKRIIGCACIHNILSLDYYYARLVTHYGTLINYSRTRRDPSWVVFFLLFYFFTHKILCFNSTWKMCTATRVFQHSTREFARKTQDYMPIVDGTIRKEYYSARLLN